MLTVKKFKIKISEGDLVCKFENHKEIGLIISKIEHHDGFNVLWAKQKLQFEPGFALMIVKKFKDVK